MFGASRRTGPHRDRVTNNATCDWCERAVEVDEIAYPRTWFTDRPELGLVEQDGIRLCVDCQIALQVGPHWDAFNPDHRDSPEFIYWLAGRLSSVHPAIIDKARRRRSR